jgi:hypothetical protein
VVVPSSKEVLYEVLYNTLLAIRTLSSGRGPLPEDRRQFIWSLAYLTHNWPSGLRDAHTDDDFDRFLAYSWHWCPHPAREWLDSNLRALGVDPSQLPEPAP